MIVNRSYSSQRGSGHSLARKSFATPMLLTAAIALQGIAAMQEYVEPRDIYHLSPTCHFAFQPTISPTNGKK